MGLRVAASPQLRLVGGFGLRAPTDRCKVCFLAGDDYGDDGDDGDAPLWFCFSLIIAVSCFVCLFVWACLPAKSLGRASRTLRIRQFLNGQENSSGRRRRRTSGSACGATPETATLPYVEKKNRTPHPY